MDTKTNQKYTPILPFDVTFGHQISMYDNATYVKDTSLISEENIKIESGNVIKFFQCINKEPLKVGGDQKHQKTITAKDSKH